MVKVLKKERFSSFDTEEEIANTYQEKEKKKNKTLKIAITGGPCAGKTTVIQDIVREFSEKGYLVLVINETASELINSGARCFGNNKISMYDFQKYILSLQITKEMTYEQIARRSNQKTIIVCDRGLLDNKAYVTNDEFKRLLSEFSLTESQVMMSYDLVIHLVTAADGKEEYYTLNNNSARTETKEEAIEIDKKTLSCWLGHPKLNVIDNSTLFAEKIDRVLKIIRRELNEEIPFRQDKYLVESIDFDKLKMHIAKQEIEEFFCEFSSETDTMMRKTKIDTMYFYTKTTKKNKNNDEIITTNRKITKEEYDEQLEKMKMIPIKKTRYSFVYNSDYYKLDIFDNPKLIILEKEITNYSKDTLPPFLTIKENITNDSKYQNASLYKLINYYF